MTAHEVERYRTALEFAVRDCLAGSDEFDALTDGDLNSFDAEAERRQLIYLRNADRILGTEKVSIPRPVALDLVPKWIENVPLDQLIEVDQCLVCGALVSNWSPVIDTEDTRPMRVRHEEQCHRRGDGP